MIDYQSFSPHFLLIDYLFFVLGADGALPPLADKGRIARVKGLDSVGREKHGPLRRFFTFNLLPLTSIDPSVSCVFMKFYGIFYF